MFQWTSNYQYTAPSGAAGVSVTPSGVAWANSAWAEIHPGTDVDWMLTGVSVGDRGTTADFEVDIGVVPVSGAISGCVPVATFKGLNRVTATYGHGVMRSPIPVDNIPAGRRVGVRMRKNGTVTTAWTWAIMFLRKPITGNLAATSQRLRALPSATGGVTLHSNTTAWGWGNWVQLTAAAAADMVVAAVGISQPLAVDYELQIGKGGVGSETELLTVKGYASQTVSCPGYTPLENPREGITSGDRVVARWRKSGTSATGADVHICYFEKPL